MKYPIDIYAKTKRGNKMTESGKAKVAIGVIFILVAIVVYLVSGLWTSLGLSFVWLIVLGIFLWIFASLQVFRFLIFKEQDRDLEDSDMFLPFYKFRPGSQKVKSQVGTYDMYELKNSSYVSVVQLRLGRNNEISMAHTQEFFNKVQDMLHVKNLGHTLVVMKEDFMQSSEANMMLKKVNSIEDPQLRASQLAIYHEVFTFAEENGSVMCFYLMVHAKNSFQKDDLEDAMVQIVTLFRRSQHLHALRSVEFVEQAGMYTFFRRFYGLGAIDLSLSKVQFNTMDPDALKSILVYRIISKNGKSYGNPILDKIGTGVRYM